MSANNPYPGLETTGPNVSALVCFRNLPPDLVAEKSRVFQMLVGRPPKITIRGDAYDEQGNLVFVTGNYYLVASYTSFVVVVSINGMLTAVAPKTTWDAVAMS